MTARVWICAALAVATLALYAPVRGLPFLLYDDPQYVTQNPNIEAGLTLDGVRWAFTSTHASNWHPLTWLSHMADSELFGASAVGPHVENAGLHALNVCLVFLWLAGLTGSIGRSAAVGNTPRAKARSAGCGAKRKRVQPGSTGRTPSASVESWNTGVAEKP